MKIKQKAWYWSLIPFAGRKKYSSTIGSTIYLTPKRYRLYQSLNANTHHTPTGAEVYTLGLVNHEQEHVKQYESDPWWFGIKYLFSRKYRLMAEVEAYGVQGRTYQQHGWSDSKLKHWCESRASQLASWRYGWLGNPAYICSMISGEIHVSVQSS